MIDSTCIYKPLWFCCHLVAPQFFHTRGKLLRIYIFLLHLLVTLFFPMHLLLGLLLQPEPEQLYRNLTISITCTACSLKHIAQLWHLPHMRQIEALLQQLDQRVRLQQERQYFEQHLQRSALLVSRSMYASYGFIYVMFVVTSLFIIFGAERQLIYTAWLPFDWQHSAAAYKLALGYQMLAIITEAAQGLLQDVYGPLTLCYLAGHTHLLALRMASVHDRAQLLACIEDHKLLMRLYQLTHQTVSIVQLVQLGSSSLNICIVIFYMMFYCRGYIAMSYYVIYLLMICLQLYPSCYYASMLAKESAQLPYAIFSGNWHGGTPQLRHDVLIFMGLTQPIMTIKAGGLVPLNLDAFIATVKMAYSLFAVVTASHNK